MQEAGCVMFTHTFTVEPPGRQRFSYADDGSVYANRTHHFVKLHQTGSKVIVWRCYFSVMIQILSFFVHVAMI